MPTFGTYYFSQVCTYCQKLITGENKESRTKARKDWWYKMLAHEREYHPKEIADNPQTGREPALNFKKIGKKGARKP